MGSMKELFRHIKVNFFLAALVYLVLGVILTIWPHTSSTVICVGFGLSCWSTASSHWSQSSCAAAGAASSSLR